MTGDQNAPGHDRALCGARTRAGGNCRRPAGWGTPTPGAGRCKLHLGATRNHQRRAGQILADQAVARLGLTSDDTPSTEILLREIGRSSALVQFYRAQMSELTPDELVWGTTRRKVRVDAGGQQVTEVEQEARPNIWTVMHDRERRALAELIEIAHRCRIEDRQIALAERDGAKLVALLHGLMAEFRQRWQLERAEVEWAKLVIGQRLRALSSPDTTPPTDAIEP
jgi:hypothetical protein